MAPTSSPNQLPEVPQKDLPDLSSDGRLNSSADMKNKRNTISEMKRINALNLEPTLPKPDDSQKARISFKETQQRGPTRSSDLKQEFQQSLSTIKTQQASKDRKQRGEAAGAASSDAKPSGSANAKGGFPAPTFNPPPKGGFNSSLSPQAAEFKPKPAGAIQAAAPAAAPAGPSPPFNVEKKPASDRSLLEIIEPFFTRAKDSAPNSTDPQWPDANGLSYREVLAVDKGAAGANAVPPMMPGRGAAGQAPPNAWQQPQGMQQPGGQQTAPGGPGHMMQQGFVMAGPGGGPNGVQMQMYPQQGGYPGQQAAAQGGGQGQGQQQQQQQPQMGMMPMQGMQGMMPQGGMPGQQMVPMGMMPMQGGPQGQQMMAMMAPMQGNQGGQPGQQQQMMMMPMMMAPGGQGQMMMAPGQMMPQNMQGQMGMQQPMQNQGPG